MKILFVAPFGLGQKTTVWARTLPLARQLVTLGHTVTLLIPPWDTPADSGKCWVDQGVEVVHTPLRGGLPVILYHLLRTIQRQSPDIVHIVKPRAHAGLVQWWLWQRRRVASGEWRVASGEPSTIHYPLSTIHHPRIFLDIDDWEQAWAPINGYAAPVAKFLAWQEEWGIRHADGITAASQWLEQRAKEYAPNTPVLYLPNGVTTNPTVIHYPLSTIHYPLSTILFLTRYVEVEPEWLAQCWAALNEQMPDARLLVAGKPLQTERDLAFRLMVEARAPAAAETIEWLNGVTPSEIDALYRRVALAIFPAQTSVLQQAKCSVRLATTLLHGVPVVASAVGEQANYGAEGAARLVASDVSPATFAQAVIDVLQNPQAQSQMIEQAQQRLLQEYSWSRLAKTLEVFYQENK